MQVLTIDPVGQIIEDLHDTPLVLVSRRGWGKSSSLKTIVQRAKLSLGERVIFKVFDSSLSWHHKAPLEYRQLVTSEAIMRNQIENIGDCVYTLKLSKINTRDFIASIMRLDYESRFRLSLRLGEDFVKTLPLIVYIVEESNTVFSSSSLLKADMASDILNNFISIGRNLGLSGVFVCTRHRELSTGIRERSRLLIGKVLGESDLRLIKNTTNKRTRELSKTLRKYHFIYNDSNGEPQTFRILDMCTTTPRDYKTISLEAPKIAKITFWEIVYSWWFWLSLLTIFMLSF